MRRSSSKNIYIGGSPVWAPASTGRGSLSWRSLTSPLSPIVQWLAMIGLVGLVGATVAGEADRWIGHQASMLLLAALAASALLPCFAFLGSRAIVAWAPLSVVGYLAVRFPHDHPLLTFDRLWIGGLIAYVLLGDRAVAADRVSRFLRASLFAFVAAFAIRAVATSTALSGPIQTWIDAIFVPTILFLAVARYSSSSERTQRLALSLSIAGGILGAIGIAERFFGFELASLSGGEPRYDESISTTRVSGVYPVPETYALSLAICLAATLYWLQARQRRPYAWALPIIALEVGGIAFTYFRAAWIAALLVIIGSLGIRPQRFERTFAVTVVIGALAFGAATQLEHYSNSVRERTTNTENIYGRLATYEQGIELFKDSPLTGIGIREYTAATFRRQPVVYHGAESVRSPHSSFIAILAEQGLFGFVPLMLLSVSVWLVVRRMRVVARTAEEGVLAGTMTGAAGGYLIMSLTLTMITYAPSNAFFAVLLGMTVGRLDAVVRKYGPVAPAWPAPSRF